MHGIDERMWWPGWSRFRRLLSRLRIVDSTTLNFARRVFVPFAPHVTWFRWMDCIFGFNRWGLSSIYSATARLSATAGVDELV